MSQRAELRGHAAASVGKCLYAGLSNQGGVNSALMARHGVLARGEPFAGEAGLFAAYYEGRYDRDKLMEQERQAHPRTLRSA